MRHVETVRMIAVYRLLCLPSLIPFYGLISDISGYVALWRYWGNWSVFVALLVLGGMKDSGTRGLAQSLKEQGHSEGTMAIAAGCCVLQTIIIVVCVRSFS
jgi:hypothetical protein